MKRGATNQKNIEYRRGNRGQIVNILIRKRQKKKSKKEMGLGLLMVRFQDFFNSPHLSFQKERNPLHTAPREQNRRSTPLH